MRIVILNGSPKGEYSITYQYAKYWESSDPKNSFVTFHIGQRIKQIEKDENELLKIFDEIKQADFILWVYPVYTFLVPYQMMRFIEIVMEKGLNKYFADKYTSQIITSRHFYDHTAYNYLKQICEEWRMKIIPGHLADMEDLVKKEGQKKLNDFISEINWMTKYDRADIKSNNINEKKHESKKIVSIITDLNENESNLDKMIQIYKDRIDAEVQTLNLNDLKLKSGCLGCLHCTIEGHCVIHDDFQEAYINFVKNSDAIIYAAKINYHWFGSVWKNFDDRQFSNGHRINLMGRPIGYLISGNLSSEKILKEVIEARVEVSHFYLIDIVTDEYDWETITAKINKMASKTVWAIENKPERPVNFQGVGGMRVFRDLIYVMRGMMQEDHKFYKKNNLYDFPHNKKLTTFQGYIIGTMMKFKKSRAKIFPQLKQLMLKPYQKVLDNLKKELEQR